MLIYRKKNEKNFKQWYELVTNDGNIITEGTSLEVLFVLLRIREFMPLLEQVQCNHMIYEIYGFYPDWKGHFDNNQMLSYGEKELFRILPTMGMSEI